MPVAPTYPGVYVQEVPSGVRTIAGVGTSIAAFVGAAADGPIDSPVECLSYTDFDRIFSGDTSQGQMPYYVKLFFMNGGTRCYVMRIANGTAPAAVRLKDEAGTELLELTAKVPGLAGQSIRALVSYAGPQPEATLNMDLFRWVLQDGKRVKQGYESWKNLTMDPVSPRYAETFLTQNSKLVNAKDLTAGADPGAGGYSQSGRTVAHADQAATNILAAWKGLIGLATAQAFRISVDGSPYVRVDLSSFDYGTIDASPDPVVKLCEVIRARITDAMAKAAITGRDVTVSMKDGPQTAAGVSTLLTIASASSKGDVCIQPGADPKEDAAVSLMLGTGQGGLEVSAYAARRPVPNGISFRASDLTTLTTFAGLAQTDVTGLTLPGPVSSLSVDLQTTAGGGKMHVDAIPNSLTGHSDGVREKLALIAKAVSDKAEEDSRFSWRAEVAGSRLTLYPGEAFEDDNTITTSFDTTPTAQGGLFARNVKYYTLGAGGHSIGQQTAGSPGSDGGPPQAADYEAAYRILDKEVDLFNLLILPPSEGPSAPAVRDLHGAASTFCEKRRAFLLMDAPEGWITAQDAAAGVKALRQGLVKDYAAVFYPRITIDDKGRRFCIGPSGAVAGVIARTDSTRGVWKAPAGLEADMRGIVGLERQLSDGENGTINPRAINALRVFPDGIVTWGARTMAGDDDTPNDYKYIPVRRLALFIEESLYRGLKWVVFEPNDEPLWAQIRLNAGAFMHDLFRKGAFQGKTPQEAYFVKCDRDTTTQTDRNLGMVNIQVGFAPLKPAEFVIIYLQQMAGQIQV